MGKRDYKVDFFHVYLPLLLLLEINKQVILALVFVVIVYHTVSGPDSDTRIGNY